MRERMWLGAMCAAVALLLAPDAAQADKVLGRSSGPFKIQIGVDANNQPVYESCGRLNLYTTSNGKEWRLEDTCDQLIDVMLPVIQPTPTPGGGGGGGGGTVTPTPGPTGSTDCPDGFIPKIHASQWSLTNIVLQEGRTYTYCVDLPASTRPFVEWKTVNKANTNCSELEMTAVSPHGAEYFSFGSQPGTVSLHTTGRWRLILHQNWGCNRYDVHVTF